MTAFDIYAQWAAAGARRFGHSPFTYSELSASWDQMMNHAAIIDADRA